MSESSSPRVRDRVAAVVGNDALARRIWDLLIARGHVDDYLDHRISEAQLVEYAKALTFYADLVGHAEAPSEAPSPAGEAGHEAHRPRLTGYEEQRAKTLAGYIELQVAGHPRVLEWRRSCWDTTHPAPCGHDLVEDEDLRDSASGSRNAQGTDAVPSGHLDYWLRRPTEHVSRVAFYRGSSLEHLRDLSETIRIELFPAWTQADAAWAVVTGKVRRVPRSITGSAQGFSNAHLAYAKINMSVEPWVSAETVTKIYQQLQSSVLGRRPRSLSERNLTMTRFVMNQLKELVSDGAVSSSEPPKMTWRNLMARWNEAHQGWAYDDERQFYRDCRRIIRTIARPYDEIKAEKGPEMLTNISVPDHGFGQAET